MENKTITIKDERLTAEEYIDFLKRTDLGSQYPKERFYDRISKLVKNGSISLVPLTCCIMFCIVVKWSYVF